MTKFVLLLAFCLATSVYAQEQAIPSLDDPSQTIDLPLNIDPNLSPLPLGEQAVADQLQETISASEWLGPMAPVALSPFFGITCLSGMALFGEGIIPGHNALISANSPLKSPTLFYSFLILTILTSIPRFTKVSKPIAQIADQVETYAGVITLLVIRYMMQPAETGDTTDVVYQAGIVSFSGETLLMLAAAINIIVINAV